ncbi:DUF3887 domain-containing protein [Clostridium sp. LIBA-8841]|uniref:DUF3887 domain-containing protein n=1 Tax=Clostridium sp. LIBA-8841 TaxID=2987530 RepID=UPI002AC520B1|nr:DUF3887 domain-containing protein [Clostridium sp. LIBA-8841]MDZ5252622.1 DUF3887 domain-containing protein [Clostridium sp. LIBA-8841]
MKKLMSILMVVFCGVLFGGCGAPKLSSDYNEEDLKAASEEVVNYLVEGKYEDIVDMGSDELKKILTKEQIEEAYTGLSSKLGNYEEIKKILFKETEEGVAVAVIAKYENGKAQFTLGFNKEIKLTAIYMK